MRTPSKAVVAPAEISGLSTVADNFSAAFCDVWGVLHNGQAAYEPARVAVEKWRAADRRVILVSNSPRPAPPIFDQLASFGIFPEVHFDALVTAGDVTRADLLTTYAGKRCYHIGPDRDLPLFDGVPVSLTNFAEAEVIVCTGLVDEDRETAEDYRPILTEALARHLPLLCANPDIVVHVGERLLLCAGAIATLYETLGGQVVYGGKPYAGVYDRAMSVLAGCVGRRVERDKILAIGDGMPTDIKGAHMAGLQSLFIAGGIHRDRLERQQSLSAISQTLMDDAGFSSTWVMETLRW